MEYMGFKHVLAIGLLSCAAGATAQNPAVLTAQYNNARTNANDNEILLDPANVNSSTFGKIGFWTLDAAAAAQPLYVPGLHFGQKTYNVLYVATMNNSVYALDADHPGAAPLWQVNFGPTVPLHYTGQCPAGFAVGSQQLGILSTPVIDNDGQTIYVVATNPVPNQPEYGFTLYALDIRTGQQKNGGSIPITASVPGTGSASVNGTVSMGQINLLQRTALLLSQGNVYVGFGSCGRDISPYHGWVVGYDAKNIQNQTVVFNSTPNGDGGGIWQSGEGLVADAYGSIYFEVGNGDTDEQINFAESFVKLSPTGTVQSFFTPSNFQMLSTLDEDLSSTAPLLTPDSNLLIGSSKQGLLYVLESSSLGGVGNFVQTFFGDTECDPMTYSQCNKVHSLAYWPALGKSRLYVWGVGDNLRTYAYNNGLFNTTPESQNAATATYPGGLLSVTSAGNIPATGIVWALTPAELHAYQATNVANELWNSNQNLQRDALVGGYHFAQPTVANGKVFVPDGQNNLVVYGLLATAAPTPQSTNSSSFNGTPISAGNYIWFNANFSAKGIPSNGATLRLTNSTISFANGGTQYQLTVPNAEIVFSPTATCSSTTFNTMSGTWTTTVPIKGDDEILLAGLAWPVPATGLTGGTNPVNWTGTFSTNGVSGVSIQWKWGAAVYSSFTTNYNSLAVKVGHQTACGQNNGDHAGTPEGINNDNQPWKQFVIGGAGGGGGSNWTGSWSGTSKVSPMSQSSGIPPLTIATTSLPDAISGRPYSFTMSASGGINAGGEGYYWSIAGSLPEGFSLSPNGVLSSTVASQATSGIFSSMDSPLASNGAYSLTVQVVDLAGNVTTLPLTLKVDPSTSSSLQFIPVTPCRVADTRSADGAFGGPEMSAKSTREFDIPQSACHIPATAVAYSLNVTVVPSGPLGYLEVWQAGQIQPLVSTLNSIDGRVKANAAITPAGNNGGVDVYVTGASHVILDIDGYFVPAGTDSALSFYPVAPCRVVDTRNPAGPLGGPTIGAKSRRDFPIQYSSCGIPATATAYSLNVTAVPKGPLGYLTIWPTGATQPLVSTLNSYSGGVVANAAIVPAGTGGQVSVYVSDASDVVMDINGYFAAPGTGGLSLYTFAPCRALDTRTVAVAFKGVLAANIEGSTCAPPSTAKAYVLNATVVPQVTLGYLTLWPDGGTQPVVSTLNSYDGAITSNMTIVPTSNGKVDAYSTDFTNLILDLSSFFAP